MKPTVGQLDNTRMNTLYIACIFYNFHGKCIIDCNY